VEADLFAHLPVRRMPNQSHKTESCHIWDTEEGTNPGEESTVECAL